MTGGRTEGALADLGVVRQTGDRQRAIHDGESAAGYCGKFLAIGELADESGEFEQSLDLRVVRGRESVASVCLDLPQTPMGSPSVSSVWPTTFASSLLIGATHLRRYGPL